MGRAGAALRMEVGLLGELIDEAAQGRLVAPLRITLQRALGRHPHPIEFGDAAEVLEQRAIRQADGKAAKVFQD